MAQDIVIGGRLHSAATGNTVSGANEILDDAKGKKQNVINQEVDNEIGSDSAAGTIKGRIKNLETAVGSGGSVDERIAETKAEIIGDAAADYNTLGKVEDKIQETKSEILGDAASDYNTLGKVEDKIQAETSRAEAAEGALDNAKANKATTLEGYGITDAYTKSETYNKTEVNGLVETPHQNYVTVLTYAALIAIDPGSTDTIYRVSNYDGSVPQVDVTKYSEYAWDGTQYVFLCVKSQIDEVFDISVYNNNATYADLKAALGTDGANVPQTLRRGGMSVKYVQSNDNKYVQYRFMLSGSFTSAQFTNPANWQGVEDVPTAGSSNLVKSGGVVDYYGEYIDNPEFLEVETDKSRRILSNRDENGIKNEKVGFTTPFLGVDDNTIESYYDKENRLEITTDKKKRIISYRDSDGVLNENVGIKTKKIKTEEIALTQQGWIQLKNHLEALGLTINSNWENKKLWWCGTSIPAAGEWNVNNTFAYPYIVGAMLYAEKVYNEAVGSSCAKRVASLNGTYEVAGRRMGNTIEDALTICADLWTINDANQTFTTGPRTLGITAIPNVNTYSDACWQRMFLLSNSYEIKLVSKYLISDTEENENYLREKFGNLYETLVNLHPNAYKYQSDIDLFVIDHGHNDSPSPVIAEDINSLDITTFNGAINTYISLIMKYKPHARIVFISDYDNSTSVSQTIEAQKQIANNWHIPFIDLREYLPFNINTKVKVRGYWGTDGYWKETGFTYNPSASDVAHAFSVDGDAYFTSKVGNTIQEIAQHINPQQDNNGVWWYEYEPRYIYIKDGLHPHTDKSGKCLKLYANVLSSFIEFSGNNIINN